MPRCPLAEISENRAPNCELSPHLRGQIERSRDLGQKGSFTADTLNLAPSTVQYTMDKSTLRNKGNNLTRKGRPKKYTERDRRQIVNFVQINPKSTYEDIRQNLRIYLSYDTLGRIHDSVGIKNWRAKGRPKLKPEHAKVQYDWALVYCEWLTEWQWSIFFDKCSIQRGKGG
jgi:Transposase